MPQKTIIHGHFYQTPACNHWSDITAADRGEQTAQSRYEQIALECYAPNSASRILDGSGKIADIINNYQYISFDFDPTLLNWLAAERADVYQRIIEADKASAAAHGGHGNAMAQVYSHNIMPLSSFEDKRTLILWGLRSFEHHFGRKSEGMWLPECAVDYRTIDLLIANGVQFVILSSDQAKACRKIGESEWIGFDDEHYVDTNAAYTIRRAHGQIAVFFYNKALSDAVSFEHLLRDAAQLANRILTVNETAEETKTSQNENEQSESKPRPQCVKVTDDTLAMIAADGKVFGHYEPFADMCLSGLIAGYSIASDQIRFTNPAEYLSECPPEWEIMLHIGEDYLGSSWSCPHGVGRWYRDCGCRSGESSQHWRTALRDALSLIKNETDEIFIRYAAGRVDSAIDVRNDYISFIDSRCDMQDMSFLTGHAVKPLSEDEQAEMLQLLEAQRCSLMMFNSDGWYGDDISDLSAIWDLRYAARVLDILECYGSKIRLLFEQKLSEAKSNHVRYGDGLAIMKYFVYDKATGYEYVINNMLAVYRLQKSIDKSKSRIFNLYDFDSVTVEAAAGHDNIYFGEVVISDRRTVVRRRFAYIYHIVSPKSYRLFVTAYEHSAILMGQTDYIAKGGNAQSGECMMLTENDLHNEIKSFVLDGRYRSYMQTLANKNIADYGDVRMLAASYRSLGMTLPDYMQSQLLVCADAIIWDIAHKLSTFPTADEYHLLSEIFGLLETYHIVPHSRILEQRLGQILISRLECETDIPDDDYSDAVMMMQFCIRCGVHIDRTSVENAVFSLFRSRSAKILDIMPSIADESECSRYLLRYKQLIVMADLCNISTGTERKAMMSYLTQSEIDNPHRF